MLPKNTRRKFIQDGIKATAVVSFASMPIASLLSSCAGTQKNTVSNTIKTTFLQEPLPYAYTALEPAIDAKTMEIHYTKHAAGYSKNLLDAAKEEGINAADPLENVLTKISSYSTKARNNAGGHYNHEMFWKTLQAPKADNKPSGKLLIDIEKTFGSFADFKLIFANTSKNRFGSGWAWLYIDKNNMLKIGSTPNQDNPLMSNAEIKGFPLLGLDVWEHAYYLKYQNKRADYIENWWSIINWDYVQSRY
jgi:superoxide dismutase, Fe-Mn family